MSIKKKHVYYNTFYFVTFTCLKWLNLFEITNIYDFVYQWFEILVKYNVYNCGFVIMPNHFHLLAFNKNPNHSFDKIIGNGKRFMAYEIVKRLDILKRDGLLKLMTDQVSPAEKLRNKKHEVFETSFDCKEIITEKFIIQKLNYIHKNPVSGKWSLADHYLNYEHSSARFYDLGEKVQFPLFHYSEIISASSPRNIIS